MRAHARDWDEPAEDDEPHLRAVDSQFEQLDPRRGSAKQDTEYWKAEARRVRAEVDALVRGLDSPRARPAPKAKRRRPAVRERRVDSDRWAAEAERTRRDLEELLREHETRDDEDEDQDEWEEPSRDVRGYGAEYEEDDVDDEPWRDELRRMQDEIADLRSRVSSTRGRRTQPRRERESEPKMKKMALLMLLADLM